jgi:hypothetical protein
MAGWLEDDGVDDDWSYETPEGQGAHLSRTSSKLEADARVAELKALA